MKKSTDFPANEPFFSVGFLGGNNVLLSRMLHTGFPIPISFQVAPKPYQQIDTGEIMDAKESHQVTPTDDPNLWGSMACASVIMTNTRHLYLCDLRMLLEPDSKRVAIGHSFLIDYLDLRCNTKVINAATETNSYQTILIRCL